MSTFLSTSGFKWINTNEFCLNNYTSNNPKGCFPEFDLEYTKEFLELPNDYPFAPDKIEIKKEMFSGYKMKIADFYNIYTGNIKNSVPSLFVTCFIMKTHNVT